MAGADSFETFCVLVKQGKQVFEIIAISTSYHARTQIRLHAVFLTAGSRVHGREVMNPAAAELTWSSSKVSLSCIWTLD